MYRNMDNQNLGQRYQTNYRMEDDGLEDRVSGLRQCSLCIKIIIPVTTLPQFPEGLNKVGTNIKR